MGIDYIYTVRTIINVEVLLMKLLKENAIIGALLTVIRVYLGYEWMMGGWGKITGGGFDASGFLQGAVGKATGDHPAVQGWWATFLEKVAIPNAELFSFLVMWGEFLVGLALILGIFTTFAAVMGMTMNFAFLLSGTTSTNPQMVIMGLVIVAAGYNAGRFGLDYYVRPMIKKIIART